MVIVQLPDDLYQYLQLVVKRYASGGIEPEEGQALYFLNDFIKKGQHLDDAALREVAKGVAPDVAAKLARPVDDPTQGVNAAAPATPEPLNDGVRSLKRGDVDH